MKFYKERVYSQKNIRDLQTGCIVIFAHTLKELKAKVADNDLQVVFAKVLSKIYMSKKCVILEDGSCYEYAYLVCLASNIGAWEHHFYYGRDVYVEENGVYVSKQDIPMEYWGEKRIFNNAFSDITFKGV